MVVEVERTLLRKCRAGDWAAYEAIVRAYEHRVYGMALGLVREPEDARDLTQDVFIRAFESLELYDPDRPFIGWVLGICRNMCIDFLRRRRRHVRVDEDPDEGRKVQLPDPRSRTDGGLLDSETRALVWKALGRLSDDHREVLVLKDIQDLEYAEIARILNIPQGTVASRVYYARRALREILEGMGVQYP
ncbi:RNA polymerase sigma factor [Gemmatimonadota bacterium]